MKRDFELIRQILLEIEGENESPSGWIDLEIKEWPEDLISYHVWLLYDAGLIIAQELSSKDGYAWKPKTITWEGHEFLNTIQDDTVWNRTKEKTKKVGGEVSIIILKAIAESVIKEMLKT